MYGINLSACRRTTTGCISGWLLLILFSLSAIPAHAQPVDTTAPYIEIEELSNVRADRTQVFTVQVEEDTQLQEVTLYYRRNGELPYTAASMEEIGNTGYYSVSIPTDYQDLRTIEYYIKASDTSGNRTVSGFAFDPYRRTLTETANPSQPTSTPTLAVDTTQPAPSETRPLLQRRWVQITLGVLAVGAIASFASDSGDETRIVPLTFTLE